MIFFCVGATKRHHHIDVIAMTLGVTLMYIYFLFFFATKSLRALKLNSFLFFRLRIFEFDCSENDYLNGMKSPGFDTLNEILEIIMNLTKF